MADSNAEGRQGGPLNPQGLRLEDLARVLSAVGWKPVTVEMLKEDIEDGAPVNADGTVNVIQYAAWIVQNVS